MRARSSNKLSSGAAGLLIRTRSADSLAPGFATILAVDWAVKVLHLPMSELTVLVTSVTLFTSAIENL